MPPKSTTKNRKRTASNVDEVATTKRPRNTRNSKQPDTSIDDGVIEDDLERKTRGKGKQGREKGKRAGGINRKGKAARQVLLATPLSPLIFFNRMTSAQKEAAVTKLKESEGSDPSLKAYVSSLLSFFSFLILFLILF